jgi:hypothetical protein
MDTAEIDKKFSELIAKRGVHNLLGIKSSYVTTLRYKMANDIGVSLETKISLLQKSGWRQGDNNFTRMDLINAVKFALRQGAAAKEHGAEYIVEKYLKLK